MQISIGSALSKSCMQKQAYGHRPQFTEHRNLHLGMLLEYHAFSLHLGMCQEDHTFSISKNCVEC